MADEDKPVSADKPRSDVYTVMLLATAAAYILGTVLAIMEMQEVKNFKFPLFGQEQYPEPSGK